MTTGASEYETRLKAFDPEARHKDHVSATLSPSSGDPVSGLGTGIQASVQTPSPNPAVTNPTGGSEEAAQSEHEDDDDKEWHTDVLIFHLIFYPGVVVFGLSLLFQHSKVKIRSLTEEGAAAQTESSSLPQPPSPAVLHLNRDDVLRTAASPSPLAPGMASASASEDRIQNQSDNTAHSTKGSPSRSGNLLEYFFPPLTRPWQKAIRDLENCFLPYWKDRVWLAFALVNFATLAVCYLTWWDGTGTFAPSWTNILG